MFKALFHLLCGTAPPGKKKAVPVELDDNDDPHAVLTMTDEMKAALFPKAPQMVSTIFERPPLGRAPAPQGRPGDRSFPLI